MIALTHNGPLMSHTQVLGKLEGTHSHDLFIARHPHYGKVILKRTGSHHVAARELRASLALRHLSIVRVLEAFDSYTVMTPCPGKTGFVPRWPSPQFFHYFLQLLEVWLLALLHLKRIVSCSFLLA